MKCVISIGGFYGGASLKPLIAKSFTSILVRENNKRKRPYLDIRLNFFFHFSKYLKIWFSYEDLQYYCKSSNDFSQEVVRFSPHIDSNSIHCIAHSSWNKKFLSFCIRRDTMMTSSQFITGVTLYRHGAQNFWLTRSHKTYPCQKQQKKTKTIWAAVCWSQLSFFY